MWPPTIKPIASRATCRPGRTTGSTSADTRCSERTNQGVNNERARQDPVQVRTSQTRFRLPLRSRLDGAHLRTLRIPEMVRVRGADADPVHQQPAPHFLDVPILPP